MIAQNKNTVSVIIPTFNRAYSLGRAVDSVLAQDYQPKEIIVVDDGSTDKTQDLLAGYADKIRVLVQENKGVSAARNLGIKKSRGDFIALLDSDDTWEKNKLSCQMAFFKSNPGAMICQTEEVWIRKGRRVNPRKKHKKPSGMIFEPSLKLCLISPSAVMIKKQLFDQKGMFNEAFPVCEDYDLWLRISHDTAVYLIDTPLTVKTGGHGDQLSAAHSQDKYRIQSILNLIKSNVLSWEQEQAALNVFKEKCQIYANGCMKRGREKEGAHYLMLAKGIGVSSYV
ncbi:MAG: glycosyl transferase [Desulfobacter postgatei]|uniref:Glycosyl transferase n=1 Tax=Desulfobacter postgatei TaxID=2293 RepID=A0A2G6MR66_9BACT|nr:MAG: glycosyl transferase [Desulfobacter postgatei]